MLRQPLQIRAQADNVATCITGGKITPPASANIDLEAAQPAIRPFGITGNIFAPAHPTIRQQLRNNRRQLRQHLLLQRLKIEEVIRHATPHQLDSFQ